MHHQQSEQKEIIREKILGQLKDSELEMIPINNQNINWEEEGKEFFLGEELYDVVRTKIVEGQKILYCINDKKERLLIDDYNLITKKNSSSDKKAKTPGNNLNLFVYEDDLKNKLYQAYCKVGFAKLDAVLPHTVSDKISPPPKA